jgi:4-hydroxyproline epimerase
MGVRRIGVIDSHTGGEPTRVVASDGPDLGPGDMAARREVFRERFDAFRSAVVNEPRGNDAMVGALLCEPNDPSCAAGVIFFNNVGYLNMCGHGTIGLLVTLAHMGKIDKGTHRIETPVGVVSATLNGPNDVTVRNVPSYRLADGLRIQVEGIGTVVGDVAWGGNWFFLIEDHGLELSLANLEVLTDYTWKVRQALARQGITGLKGEEIDHVELNGPPSSTRADGRNFVLCPGKAYDRSPCGTGTSARIACQVWRQESIIGTVFEARGTVDDVWVIPEIRGTAYVNAEATLLVQDDDPLAWGIGG